MRAGTTVWSPIRHHGVRAGMETAVLGVGGLEDMRRTGGRAFRHRRNASVLR